MTPVWLRPRKRKAQTTLNQAILIFGFGIFFFADGLMFQVGGWFKTRENEALFVGVLFMLMGAFMALAGFLSIHNVVRRLVAKARKAE